MFGIQQPDSLFIFGLLLVAVRQLLGIYKFLPVHAKTGKRSICRIV